MMSRVAQLRVPIDGARALGCAFVLAVGASCASAPSRGRARAAGRAVPAPVPLAPSLSIAGAATLASPAVPALLLGCFSASHVACNPLTNAGCGPGEACDDDERGGFRCYAPPNEAKEGADCNVVEGPSCAPRLGCNGASEHDPDGECGRFCCAREDCRRGERCVPVEPGHGSLGFCE